MKHIKRAVESLITKARDTFKCVLLMDARQTGKSAMLKELLPDIRYVSFGDAFLEEQAKTNPGVFLQLNELPVIFDEVQHIKGLFRRA